MNALPPGVEHLIVQLGDAAPLAAFSSSGTKRSYRYSDCVPPPGILGDHVVIQIQPYRHIGEVEVERVYEQVQWGCRAVG